MEKDKLLFQRDGKVKKWLGKSILLLVLVVVMNRSVGCSGKSRKTGRKGSFYNFQYPDKRTSWGMWSLFNCPTFKKVEL